MAKRQRTSVVEDLIDILAWMPWWVGVSLALVSYLLLHHLAQRPLVTHAPPGQVGGLVVGSFLRALTSVGQYIVPGICLAGAGVSAYRRTQRRRLADTVANAQSASILDGMTWQQFEQLVGEGFRRHGYQVAETGGGGADGGVDLVLVKEGEIYLVQCKQWRAMKVGVDVVRELYGSMAARGAAGGFVVTSGLFTDDASAFASGRNIELIDGRRLHEYITSTRRESATASTQRGRSQMPEQSRGVVAMKESPDNPKCPVCAKPMVARLAKRGNHAGERFWGCSAYPACRGTRSVG